MPLARRLGPLLVVGALSGALSAPGTAVAAPKPQVIFTGTAPSGLLGCTSTPNVRTMRVPAETTVTVVNRLGRRAELVVNGADYGGVPKGSQVGVTLHRGPVRLSLVPGCLLSGAGEAVVIEVTGARAAAPATIAPSAGRHPDPDAAASGGAVVEVGTAGPVPPAGGTSGLLVLVAGILVVGVSIMAIRAIAAERPSIIRSDRRRGPAHRSGHRRPSGSSAGRHSPAHRCGRSSPGPTQIDGTGRPAVIPGDRVSWSRSPDAVPSRGVESRTDTRPPATERPWPLSP